MELGNSMKDLRGHVAELKKAYFTTKEPITDNNDQLRHFCVKLEYILRFGQKEKYSFIGGRKDYWNFISESLPRDETIKYVQSLGEVLKSNQGKGRAFIRQALQDKTLADTLQRCVIHHKTIREWYHHASVLRDAELFGILLHSLYDLNSVEFTLPCKGYDLDRAWPSFARKSFNEVTQLQRNTSVTDVDGGNHDPLPAVAAQVEAIKSLVSDDDPKLQSLPKAMLEEVSMKHVLTGLTDVHRDLEHWKGMSEQKIKDLTTELRIIATEKESLERELKANEIIKGTVQQETDKAKEYYGKLRVAELELGSAKEEGALMRTKLEETEKKLCETCEKLAYSENNIKGLMSKVDELNGKISSLMAKMKEKDDIIKEADNRIADLERDLLMQEEIKVAAGNEATELRAHLMQKEIELDSVKSTFEKVSGIVAGSFKEFEKELSLKMSDKDKTMEFTSDENKALIFEFESLKREADTLKEKVLEAEINLENERKLRENAAKVIQELKEKITEDQVKVEGYEDLVDGITSYFSSLDFVDGVPDYEDGLKKNKDKKWVLEKLNVIHSQLVETIKDKEEWEGQSTALKYEVAQLTKRVEESRTEYDAEIEKLTAERDNALENVEKLEGESRKITVELQSKNEEIFSLSVQLSDSNEEVANKTAEVDSLRETLAINEEELDNLKILKERLEVEKRTTEEEVELKEEQIRMLGLDSEAQVTALHAKVDELSKKLFDTQQKLAETETALAGRKDLNMTLDSKIVELQEQMKAIQRTKDQDLQALKFQLSSEVMKHEGAIKALSGKMKECDTHVQQIEEMEKMLESFKGNMQEGHENWGKEKEALTLECDNLAEEILDQKDRIDKLEGEVSVLEHELLRTTKQRDEEKSQRIIVSEKLETVLTDARAKEKQMQAAAELLQRDVKELKAHLVVVTKEKSELWQRSDLLEHELKQRSEGRWIDDEEVLTCADCRAEFSLLIRKHHCRICGNIFCAMCSNNWIRTQHSRRKVRACNDCAHHAAARANSMEAEGYDTKSIYDESPSKEATVSFEPIEASNTRSDSDDVYEVLTEKDIDESKEFKPVEEIALLETDQKCEPLLPSLTADDEISRERKEVQIYARQRYLVPVVVGSAKVDLCWEFSSFPKDIGFGMVFKRDEQAEDAEVETIMSIVRYPSDKRTVFGKVKIDKPGIYILVFDNSFSRITSKDVTCLVGLQRSQTFT